MSTQTSLGFFHRLVKGSLPLWQAFWIAFVLFQISLYALYVLFLYVLLHVDDQSKTLTSHSILLVMVISYTTAGMILTAVISWFVWKCAPNTEQPFFTLLARIIVSSYCVLYGVKVISIWSFQLF